MKRMGGGQLLKYLFPINKHPYKIICWKQENEQLHITLNSHKILKCKCSFHVNKYTDYLVWHNFKICGRITKVALVKSTTQLSVSSSLSERHSLYHPIYPTHVPKHDNKLLVIPADICFACALIPVTKCDQPDNVHSKHASV